MNDWYPKEEKKDWSSAIVVLSLLGVGTALTASSCQPQPRSPYIGGSYASSDSDERRNEYQTKEACEADYSATECEPQARSGGSSASGGFLYLGPRYYGNWRSFGPSAFAGGGGPGRAALASPTGVVAHPTQTTRGGFGSTGRGYSSRGS
jgi:hypothetical protein